MYNGLSQVYCIKPEERIHSYTKGKGYQVPKSHNLAHTRVIFYVRREVDLMKTANVNAYIMHIFGKIELLSIHAT